LLGTAAWKIDGEVESAAVKCQNRMESSHEQDAGCAFATVEFQRIFWRCFHPEMPLLNGGRMMQPSFECFQPQEVLMDLPKY